MVNVLTVVCKCINKVFCGNNKNRNLHLTNMDLKEWKRIEGIDQYNRKRH